MATNSKNPLTTILQFGRQCVIGLCLVLLMTFAWSAGSWNSTARADSLTSSVKETVQELDQKGKAALDEVAGAGTSSKIEGKVDRATGAFQKQTGSELKGAAKQARGKAKEDIGTVQETSENIIDSIKSFFDADD